MSGELVEMPLKQWVTEEARRLGLSTRAMYVRLYRRTAEMPPVRRVNQRVVLVLVRAT